MVCKVRMANLGNQDCAPARTLAKHPFPSALEKEIQPKACLQALPLKPGEGKRSTDLKAHQKLLLATVRREQSV